MGVAALLLGTTQQAPPTGVTLDKGTAETHGIDAWLDLAGAATVYATDTQDYDDLYARRTTRRSALAQLSDNALLARLQAMADTIGLSPPSWPTPG